MRDALTESLYYRLLYIKYKHTRLYGCVDQARQVSVILLITFWDER